MEHIKNNVKLKNIKLKDKTFPACRWGIVNKHLWNTLNSYGCTPKKSLILKFPDINIFKDKSLIRHFIRGYFDGDGCISYAATTKNKSKFFPVIVIVGTKDILDNIMKYSNIKGFYPTAMCGKAFEIRFSQNNSRDLIKYLYDDCTIYLERKFKRAMFFKNNCRSAKELAELLASENGEDCDVDPVISEEIKESSTL